jgi:hypothetical protein
MLITKVQSDKRGCTATLVFFALSSMTDLPRSAASCENGRLSNKEDSITSSRSHVTSAKLAKKCVQGKPTFETTVNNYRQKRFVKT